MVYASVGYPGGLDPRRDKKVDALAAKHGGERTSSGCGLVGCIGRDLEYKFKTQKDVENFYDSLPSWVEQL